MECLAPAIVIALGRQVFRFLSRHELPGAPRLIEGVHHASRASAASRDITLGRVSQIASLDVAYKICDKHLI